MRVARVVEYASGMLARGVGTAVGTGIVTLVIGASVALTALAAEPAPPPAGSTAAAIRSLAETETQSRRAARAQLPADPIEAAKALHPQLFAEPAWAGLQAADGDTVHYSDDNRSAVIERKDASKNVVVNATLPLRAKDADGKPAPVDLSLADREAGLQPRTPLVTATFPQALNAAASIGDVWQVAVKGAVAKGRLMGPLVAYPDALKDVDALWKPTALGATLFTQLRAPGAVTLTLAARNGLTLRERDGAIEAVEKDQVAGRLLPPRAIDADGRMLVAHYELHGDSLTVTTATDQQTAWPVMVDQRVVVGGDDAPVAKGWATAVDPADAKFELAAPGRGITAVRDHDYGDAGQTGEWRFAPPNANSFVSRFELIASWTTGGSSRVVAGIAADRTAGKLLSATSAASAFVRHCQLADCSGDPKENAGGVPAFFQLTATGSYDQNAQLPQITTEAVTIYQGDKQPPTVGDRVELKPAGWTNGDISVTASASDEGLGIVDLGVRVGDDVIRQASTAAPCGTPNADPCPGSFDATLSFTGEEGVQKGLVEARDRTLKTATREFSYKADRTAPEVAEADIDGSRTWVGGDISVTAKATDAHAGVRVLRLRQGGKEIAASDPACAEGADCPAEQSHTLTVDRAALAEGALDFDVVAEDSAGNRSEPRALGSVRVDHRAPAVMMSGSLVEAGGAELSGGTYTLQVNASDGSSRSGVKRIVFRLDGEVARTHDVAECSDAKCPADAAAQFDFKPEKEGTGKHVVEVETTDLAGNTDTQQVGAQVVTVLALSQESLGFEDWLTYDSMETGAGGRASVNLTSGNFLWTKTPVAMRGRGLSPFVRLTYNSMEPNPSSGKYLMAGRGISVQASGLTRLNEPLDVSNAATQINLTDGDGTRHVFTRTLDGGRERYVSPKGVHLWLRRFTNPPNPDTADDPKRWAITRPDGVTYFFDKNGFQRSIVDRNGNTITFNYADVFFLGQTTCGISPSGCGRAVSSITDATGRQLTFVYGGNLNGPNGDSPRGTITSITDHTGRVTRFVYTGDDEGSGPAYLSEIIEAQATTAERTTKLEWTTSSTLKQLIKMYDPRAKWTQVTYSGTGVSARATRLDDRRRTWNGTGGNRRNYGYATSGVNTVTSVGEPFAPPA